MNKFKINIKNIKKEDYDSIRALDESSFERDVSRSMENIESLCFNHSEGCFIGFLGEKPVGYIISHRFGKIGYIGPMGIEVKYHNRGYGQELIKSSLKVLTQKCKVIGVETFPGWGKNIAFFHRLGFRETFPGRIMTKSTDSDFSKNSSELRSNLVQGSAMDETMQKAALEEISTWGSTDSHGMDLSLDVAYFLKYYPENILFFYETEVKGFLAFHKDYNPFYWGLVKPSTKDISVFQSLLYGAAQLSWSTVMKIHFQTNFSRVTKLLLGFGFHIEQDVSCLLYSSYSGNYFKKMDEIAICSWWG